MKNFILFFCLVVSSNLFSQMSDYISKINLSDVKENNPISITAELMNAENILQLSLFYKGFGEADFKKVEMVISGTQANAVIPASDVNSSIIEYYFLIELRNGNKQFFPIGIDQGVAPFQIAIGIESQKAKEILVLSPDEGEIFTEEDFLISISFVRANEKVDINKTKIYLNNFDISSFALIDQDLIVVTSEQIKNINLLETTILEIKIYDNQGNEYLSIKRKFKVINTKISKSEISSFQYRSTLRAEARNENTNNNKIFYKNISGDFTSSYSDWKLNANVYLTSEEKENLQPFNRYVVSIQHGDLFSLKYGDAFPNFSNLILNGKRVRGFSGEMNLGFFNIQTTYGEVTRSIEGKIIQKYDQNNVPLSSDVISINQLKYGAPYAKVNFGLFKRQLFAIRPSFGSGENFQLGFTYLHGIDDKNSIEFGKRPKENLVLGTDLKIAMDDNNIIFTNQAAFSLYNKDISTGTLTDAQIDSIFTTNKDLNVDANDVKNIKNAISKFITVNQYLGPWNPQKLSSFGAESNLSLNYLNNNLRASYIYRGNEYHSFGQSYLRTDIKGINIIDRIKMIDNKLFLTIGYESLQDNLQKTKLSTTSFKTINASVSFFPRMNFPNITIGYSQNQNKNGIDVNDVNYSNYAVDDITNRISILFSYDLFYYIKHSVSFSFTNSERDDRSINNSDSKFLNISMNVNNYWNNNLFSYFGLVYNKSEIVGYPFDYFTLAFGGKYILLENKLDLSANISPSFGDFKRQAFEVLANYFLLQNFTLSFQARVYRIQNQATNSIVGVITRYSF